MTATASSSPAPAGAGTDAKDTFRKGLDALVSQYVEFRTDYETQGYSEAQARIDFINPLFDLLGWDIDNKKKRLPPIAREVLVEPVTSEGRPDYAFRIDKRTRFLVEAKAPSVSIDNVNHIMQLKAYAYSSRDVTVAILTNFGSFKVYDAAQKPDERHPDLGLIFEINVDELTKNVDRLWAFQRESVEAGSLEQLLPKDPESKERRIPVDESFLGDMTVWRTALAKDLFKRNKDITARHLADIVQRVLDRVVFLRMAEDRAILPPRGLFEIVQEWRARGVHRPLMPYLNRLFSKINDDLNGEVFKPHDCEKEQYWFDSELLAKIIEGLYVPKSPYRFDAIGVELLGSMYERYLGKTIRLTEHQVRVEDKFAALKEHGVYYTPDFVVKHIVGQTVGKAIAGKSPTEILEIAVLDPACGSGSFLVAAFQALIDYHIGWYEIHPEDAKRGTLFPNLIREGDISRLSIERKGEILRNCVYGVDIDPQAVEITMMSLYIKTLEGERTLPENKSLLPSLRENIRLGDSLSPPDAKRVRQATLDNEDEVSPFVNWRGYFRDIFSGERPGFDVVIGNPPYVSFGLGRVGKLPEDLKEYYRESFPGSAEFKISIYALFLELAFRLCRPGGRVGYIVPDSFLTGLHFSKLRGFLLAQQLDELLLFEEDFWPSGSVGLPVIIVGAARAGSGPTRIAQVRSPSMEPIAERMVNSRDWARNPASRFRLILRQEDAELCDIVEGAGAALREVLEVHQGLNRTHRAANLADRPRGKSWKKCLADADCVRPFTVTFHNQWLDARPAAIGGTEAELATFEKPKLLFPRTGDDAYCAVDEVGYFPTNALIFGTPLPTSRWDLHALAALLNSTLLRRFHQATTMKAGRVFPQIEVDGIEGIPLPRLSKVTPTQAPAVSLKHLVKEIGSDSTDSRERLAALERLVGQSPTGLNQLHDLLSQIGRAAQAESESIVSATAEFVAWLGSESGLSINIDELTGRRKIFDFAKHPQIGSEAAFSEIEAILEANDFPISGRKRALLRERYDRAAMQIKTATESLKQLRRICDTVACLMYGLTENLAAYVEGMAPQYGPS